jgi:hypothetical protein
MRRFLFSVVLLALSLIVSAGYSGCASSGSDDFGEGGIGVEDSGGGHMDSGPADTGAHTDVGLPDVSGGHKDGTVGDGGDGGEGGKPAKLTIGGTVTGLTGSGLVLADNGTDNLSITKNGAFTFAVPVMTGGTYAVTVSIQPVSPDQTCTVSGGTGTVATSDVTSVVVNCAANTYTIGGMISGLSGTVVLQDNGGDNLTLTANGSFAFATPVAEGSPYAVTVYTQPSLPSQTCTVTTGTGSGVVAMANITSVLVTCTTNTFTIGGTVSMLAGSGLVLLDNGVDPLAISSNGAFTFSTALASGSSYTVSFMTQPSSPTQVCAVTNGIGTVTTADVTNVDVSCTTQSYTIGGMLSGLSSGDTIILEDNGGDNLTLTANGAFTFATPVLSGNTYTVTVGTPPSPLMETCTVSMGTGTVTSADIISVTVSCATDCGRFTSGYSGAWSTVAADPFSDGMGMSGYLPAGATATMYPLYFSEMDQYSSATNTYTALAAPPVEFSDWPSAAYISGSLWVATGGDIIGYDIATNTWTTAATGLTIATLSQTTNDDSGNLWTFSSESTLLEYDTLTSTSSSHALKTALTYVEGRIVYDSCSDLLYITSYNQTAFYSYSPSTGVQTTLAGLPGGLYFQDGFCGDRSGHIFAVIDGSPMYQYTIATNTWVAMPSGGVVGNAESACGVGSDGYLYATDPGESTTMYRIKLD